MDIAIRRAALRATAKVALSFTVMGCGHSVAVGQPDGATEEEEAIAGKGDGYGATTADGGGQLAAGGAGGAGGMYAAGGAGGRAMPDDEALCAAPLPETEMGEFSIGLVPIALDGAQLECCAGALPELVSVYTSLNDWDAWNAQKGDDDIQGCCNVAIQHIQADFQNGATVGSDVQWACCDALGHPVGPACTPWGPPVPPSFDGDLAELWEVA
jgi:hypothetical protein